MSDRQPDSEALRAALEVVGRKAHIGTLPDAVSATPWFRHIEEYVNKLLAALPPSAPPALDVERLHAARCLRSIHGPIHLPECDCADIAAEYARDYARLASQPEEV